MLARKDFPFLIVVADWEFVGDTRKWLQILSELEIESRGNPRVAVQVRIKNVDRSEYQSLAEKAIDVLGSHTRAVLNGDIEVARQLGYWGAHTPVTGNPFSVKNDPDLHFVSASIHGKDQLKRATRFGVSAVLCSPVLQPSWKNVKSLRFEGLRQLARASAIPTYALGGITPAQCEDCLEAGAIGVAVLSGVMGAEDPVESLGEYLRCAPQS
ncbi:MAG: thiamine phosphate synthase [Gammaproteobacteria bacterium]|nr:thiamine phosphate synthase [Gammaproteobacteria bacterium]